ncbi:hypothetical protein A1O7_03712 [Cladophialophora yegresii CBS 114405]|uniref:MIT domain-containing protein n=1 Tax=Cladophialophora yegresii CBS 114405 TaxID=1182544 RepID=W9W4V5_9EURO|nr:uncharacterized protein A1O7_03712 [Cladophialophora yegresii CBS 114405]EXJ59566.1 hypothetical protein A1O7_03712 [Cladophialophora yegresii CBS 114405]
MRARANISSRRMSVGPSLVTSATPAKNMHTRRSSSQSPQVSQGSNSAFLQVERAHAPRDISPAGVSPRITPTSMFNPTAGEYFGETWQSRKPGKNGDAVAVSVHYMKAGTQFAARSAENITTPYMTQVSRPATRERRPETAVQEASSLDPPSAANAPTRGRSHRSPTQKTMLSKALAVANNAVLLDNAQNIEGAIEAYAEACDLLQQVLIRSSILDDRKRLSDIRNAYSKRIADLHDLDDSFSELMEKALPDDPPFDETNHSFFASHDSDLNTAEVLESVQIPPRLDSIKIPPRQESLLPEIFGGDSYTSDTGRKRPHIPSLTSPMDSQYMPPPLSPRRPASPASDRDTDTSLGLVGPSESAKTISHSREDSTESISWLDTVEDGESSTSRSSRLSSVDYGIHDSHNLDEFEAEFDAALDAAVDAAYDDDLTEEPTPRPDRIGQEFHEELSSPIPPLESAFKDHSTQSSEFELTREYDEGDSSDEEERLLEEMTKGFVFDDFSFDNKSKSALPRQSDSSTFSGRTWTSSLPSTTATNNTALSTLAESNEAPAEISPRPVPPAKDTPPLSSPPKAALPRPPSTVPPTKEGSRPISPEKYGGLNIRERRFSGRTGEQLKIETFARGNSSTLPKPLVAPPSVPELEIPSQQSKAPFTAPLEPTLPAITPLTPLASMPSNDSIQSESPATPALTQGGSQGSIDDSAAMPPSPAKLGKMLPPPTVVKKNLSSSSLRVRNLSVATTETNGESPITPLSASFGTEAKKIAPPLPSAALPTPSTAGFGPHLLQSGGMYLFDDLVGRPSSPTTPRSPDAPGLSAPQPLEACPESFLIRPFWLMRCLYQTLAHPSGGYVTTKLFIPRDIWRVRNVKLKALEDKVAQCDLLTAALLKLAKVDTFDADAVLEELQSFEAVLDQVRSTLQKKISSDVGFSSSSSLFKSAGEDLEAGKSGNAAAKSIASSWRKLRSKSSAPAMGNQKDAWAQGPTMASLPMTSSSSVASSRSHTNRKIAPPPTPTELTNVPAIHAAYMSSLARLFDAAQVLDGIARQVEDPGLKCSNKTQVGLELGVKNAAEFFAFFVIRFVMADLMLLVDKFLKRGSEWVLT